MSTATTERPKTVENIKVLQIGKFGVRVGEKDWFGVNEPLTPQHFTVGQGYKVSAVTSKTGKKYINEILGVESEGPALATPPPASQAADAPKGTTTAKHPSRAGYDKPLTEYDLAKDRQIGRSGIIQAALQSPAPAQWATNLDEYLSNVKKVADFALKYSQE